MGNSSRDRLRYLLTQYANQSASPLEEEEFFDIIANENNEAAAKAVLQELMSSQQPQSLDRETVDRLLWSVFNINERTVVKTLVPWHWLAAASLILVLGLSAYFIWLQPKQQPPFITTQVPVASDIAPGGDKAILTLADGRQVVLDTTIGTIGREAGVTLSNKGGQLVYSTTGFTSGVSPRLYNVVATPMGGQYQVILADGSKVWLNAASSLRFPATFTGDHRIVEITGEAYFEVAHNPRKPFIVYMHNPAGTGSTDGLRVEVLGTHFNINGYGDDEAVKTTLLEGKVRVTRAKSVVNLKPGQQAIAPLSNGDSITLTINGNPDLEEVLGWKNGTFNFNNTNLKTVMRQLARWYNVEVEYQGRIPQKTFKGEINMNVPASKVLEMLEYLGVHFKIEGKKIVVMP